MGNWKLNCWVFFSYYKKKKSRRKNPATQSYSQFRKNINKFQVGEIGSLMHYFCQILKQITFNLKTVRLFTMDTVVLQPFIYFEHHC